MLPKNVVAPYTFKMEARTFLFNMHYARVDEHIHQLCQLHRASSLHACEQNDMVRYAFVLRNLHVKNENDCNGVFCFLFLDCYHRLLPTQTCQIRSIMAGGYL